MTKKPRLHVPKDDVVYKHVFESPRCIYGVRDDGVFMITKKDTYEEFSATLFLKRGKACVTLNHGTVALDVLMARAFIPEFDSRTDHLKHIDGDPFNCAPSNLQIVPRTQRASEKAVEAKSKRVMVGETIYPSIQACADALYVSRATVFNRLYGSRKRTILDDVDIRFVDEELSSHDIKSSSGSQH